MNYLYRIGLALILLSALALSSCKESTVVPYENVPENIQKYFAQKWVVARDTTGADSSNASGWILDFKSDGTYTSSSPNASSTHGRWVYNPADSSVTLIPSDGSSETTFHIDSISIKTIVLKSLHSGSAVNLSAQSDPIFSIRGAMHFDKNIAIPKNPMVGVFWKAAGSNDSFLWGTGTIDELTNTYSIDFDAYPPDSLVKKFYGCNGKVGVGNIYLFSDPGAMVTGKNFHDDLPLNTVGTVRNKAVVFLFGSFEGSTCANEVPWVHTFSNGYNMAQAIFLNPPYGSYGPNSGLGAELVITDDSTTFAKPVWWR